MDMRSGVCQVRLALVAGVVLRNVMGMEISMGTSRAAIQVATKVATSKTDYYLVGFVLSALGWFDLSCVPLHSGKASSVAQAHMATSAFRVPWRVQTWKSCDPIREWCEVFH
jgi:hypothetical protein